MKLLALRMLFRKGGTASAILAVALLVAILASMNSIINHINSQTEALSRIPQIGEAYLILSKNTISITDSQVDAKLADSVRNTADVNYVISQKVFVATLATNSGNHTALVRVVEDVQIFLNVRNSYVNGAVANAGEMQVNVGEVLARLASIHVGDEVSVTVGGRSFKVKVVGIVKTLTQSDTELIVPMKVANHLSGEDDKVSFIEFVLKDNSVEETISRITVLLPANTKVVKVQQLKNFMQDINSQTVSFLGLWSLMVYIVVTAASYVLATRLIAESSYDLAMLRALGAKKRLMFKLVITYTTTIVLLASTLGIAIGISGTQVASTIFKWIWPIIEINLFLEPGQALQILLLTLVSSILGCIYPAFRSARKGYMEQPL